MSRLQKSIIVIAIAVMLMFTYVVNVQAATMANLVEWNVVTSDGNTYTLTGNAKQDIVVGDGETVVLDLGGYNLINYTNGCSTITVEAGGTLTITGSGTISNSSTNGVPVISNNGTLYVEGGVVEASYQGATGIYNSGTLTVTAGEVKTTVSDCWGITNVGTATITGGIFTQGANYSVLLNAGNMSIEGGTIAVAEGNTSAYSIITNESSAKDGSANLTIKDGNINGAIYNDGDKVVITGGTFSSPSAVEEYLDSSVRFDADGNVIEANADYTKVFELLDKVDTLNESDYTAESWKALQDEIAKIATDLKYSDQATVDGYATAIENAINELDKVVVDDGKEELPTDGNNTTETPTENVPTNTEGQPTNTVEDNVTENPTTGDSIVVFGVIFAVAVVGLTVTLIVKKRMK